MRIGYERIYPSDPDHADQHDALIDSGCMTIYTDDMRQIGAAQPQLALALERLRPGDTLTVISLDRLAHNGTSLVTHVTQIEALGAHLHILENELDTHDDPDRIFFRTIAAVHDVNATGRSQRIRRSINTAKKHGKRPGRPTIKTDALVQTIKLLVYDLDEHGNRRHTIADIARQTGVSRASIYRYLKLFDIEP